MKRTTFIPLGGQFSDVGRIRLSWFAAGPGIFRRAGIVRDVNRVRQSGLLAAAIDLVQWASETRIGHLHGHSCANSAHLLALDIAWAALLQPDAAWRSGRLRR